jgi:uncharacterized membrane protein
MNPNEEIDMRKRPAKGAAVMGVAWYRPEQWKLLRKVSADVEDLEETHSEWMAEANKTLTILKEEDVCFVKVDVDVEELVKWCSEKGVKIDGAARSEFVVYKLQQPKPN